MQCSRCLSVVGFRDVHAGGIRLFKWSIALGFNNRVQLQRPDFEHCISARLLAISEACSARKIVIEPVSSEYSEAILIWIFTPDYWLTYSHGANASSSSPTRAMKVLWKPYPTQATAADDNLETLDLPEATFSKFLNIVNDNARHLPPSALKYEDWNVSFVKRFSTHDQHEP